jgi:hemoglobin/transferrin/lactoferrin receptor protein
MRVVCLSVLAIISTTLPAAAGQSAQGAIAVLVRDAQGGVLAGATVDIVCGAERRRMTTASNGELTASGLPPGRCAVTASSDAFEPETVTLNSVAGVRGTLVLQVRRFTAEVVVTPSRGADQRTFDLPESLSVTSRRDIDSRAFTLLPQVLREEPGVLVQQTTSGQTSPSIRGFTGQSNVYLVDGVRLNVGQWRAGPNQYTAWIDGGPVDSIEVVRGGGSVQYGSDALGGTVQFLSTPTLVTSRMRNVTANVELTAASAAESVGGQADLAFRVRSANIRIGGSGQHVNDLRAGDGLDSHSAVTRFFGLPSTVLGSRQIGTGYDQRGVYGVATAGLGDRATLRGLFMHESQTGASRYDRILGGEGLFASGFDPQTLDLAFLRYSRTDVGPFDGLSATFSLNRQADGRFEQARPTARLDRQDATTTALGYQAQVTRGFGARHHLLVGVEYYDESIDAQRELVDPGPIVTPARPDIADGTSYTNLGIFAQHALQVVPNRLSLRGGIRFGSFGFSTTPDAALGVSAETVDQRSMTFQAAAVIGLSDSVRLTASVNRGFRAANAADLGAIGLTGGGGFEIAPSTAAALNAVVGSTAASGAVSTGVRVPELGPEVVYQYEVGLKTSTRRFGGAISVFDMELYDFIQRRALVFDSSIAGTTISGFTVVRTDATGLAYIAPDVRPITTRVNVDRARVRGFDVEGEARFGSDWTASSHFSMSNGRLLTTGEFARRMPPAMGAAKLRWNRERFWAEGVLTFAAEQSRLNSGDLSDARIGGLRTRASIATFFNGTATDRGLVRDSILVATGETLAQVQNRVLGTAASAPLYTSEPGYAVIGLRSGVRLTPQLDVAVIGENLGDVNYRFYGSGLDASGINLHVRTRYRF